MTAEQIYAYALFSDPQEQLAAVLGKDAAKEFFSTGNLGEGFAVLSDRRLYCRGFCLLRRGHRFSKRRTERTVDVANITDFRLVTPAPRLAHRLLIVFWSVLLSYGLIDFIEHWVIWGPVLLGLGLGFIGLLLWLIHRLRQRIFLEVASSDGTIGLEVTRLDVQEIELFREKLRLVIAVRKARTCPKA